jgi:hypothetical protein
MASCLSVPNGLEYKNARAVVSVTGNLKRERISKGKAAPISGEAGSVQPESFALSPKAGIIGALTEDKP